MTDIEKRSAELQRPFAPRRLEDVLEDLPLKPRYIGPEAWFAALCASGPGGENVPAARTHHPNANMDIRR